MDETCHVGMDDGVAFHVTNLGRGPSRRMCQARQVFFFWDWPRNIIGKTMCRVYYASMLYNTVPQLRGMVE